MIRYVKEINISPIGGNVIDGGFLTNEVRAGARNYFTWEDNFGRDKYAYYSPSIDEMFRELDNVRAERNASYRQDISQDWVDDKNTSGDPIKSIEDKQENLRNKIYYIHNVIDTYIKDEIMAINIAIDTYYNVDYGITKREVSDFCQELRSLHRNFLEKHNISIRYNGSSDYYERASHTHCPKDYTLNSSKIESIGSVASLESILLDYLNFQLTIVNLIASKLPTTRNQMFSVSPLDNNVYLVTPDSPDSSNNVYKKPARIDADLIDSGHYNIPNMFNTLEPQTYDSPDFVIFSVVELSAESIATLASYPKLDGYTDLFSYEIYIDNNRASIHMIDYEGTLFTIDISPAPIGKTAIKTVLSGPHVKISIADQTGLRITKTGTRSTRDVTFDHKRIIGT